MQEKKSRVCNSKLITILVKKITKLTFSNYIKLRNILTFSLKRGK